MKNLEEKRFHTPRRSLRMACLALCLCVSAGAMAAPANDSVSLQLIPQSTTVTPGSSFEVALVFTLTDGWTMYSPDPQSKYALPLEVSATATGVEPAAHVGPWRFLPDTPKTSLVGEETITINSYTACSIKMAIKAGGC